MKTTENVIYEEKVDHMSCQSCDFRSKWKTGLKVHMFCSHKEMDKDVCEQYESTSNYWKTGHLGTIFQRFLDANDLIDGLEDLSKQEKTIEKDRILEARKSAFNGENWRNFPPWSK